MSQNTFPKFTNMIVNEEDLQIIVDSLRDEDRNRITRDGIFTPGIVNEKSDYLSNGSKPNTVKIKPFVAYTKNGNRIEVETAWDNLYPSGNIINVSTSQEENINIPVWRYYSKNYTNLSNESSTTATLDLADLGIGSVLHGIKLRTNTAFTNSSNPNVYVSIGIENDLEKFLPKTLISQDINSTDLSAMNLLYSLNDESSTSIKITFTSDVNLNTLTSGTLTVNLCVANLEGFENIETVTGGDEITSMSEVANPWQTNTLYHIVARYDEVGSNARSLNYTDSNGNVISTTPENTRYTTSVKFFALRKSGSVIDYTTSDDVKLGEVVSDSNGNITIYINGKNAEGDDYTQYLSIPGYRFTENIDASQIADGSVDNIKFQYLNTLTGNVQNQLESKAGLNTDNIFKGENTFEKQISGSIDKVNGYTAYATPIANSLLVLDSNGKVPASAISESTIASIGNIYTASSGLTTNGRADFLSASSDNTKIIVNASASNPLVLNYSDGSSETFVENQEISGITTDGNYYIVKEKNGNFVFLPTAGGTKASISTPNTNNSFETEDGNGYVESYFEPTTAYKAFDGTTTTGTRMGEVYYENNSIFNIFLNVQYRPSSTPTYLIIHFPQAINPSAFSACFRKEQYDVTPKAWTFEATNDDISGNDAIVWDQLVSSENSTWDINEIKTTSLQTSNSYKNFRFSFNVNFNTVNNYMWGERSSGVTLPINCYYFQIYANIDNENKGNIVEGYVKPTNMNIGSYFLDISKKPYTGYKCIGNNEYERVDYVKLGFVNITGLSDSIDNNTQITCHSYCYNTFTISEQNVLNTNTPISFNHNLGMIPNIINVKYICLETNNGYNVGDSIDNMYSVDEDSDESTEVPFIISSVNDTLSTNDRELTLRPGSTLYVRNKTTNKFSIVENGKWAVIIYCSRGW